jgi:tetratricopeptide (TPR) repeat protein
MSTLRSAILAAVMTAAFALTGAQAAGIQTPGDGGMRLQSADPDKKGKAPRKRKPASEGQTKTPDKKSEQQFLDGYRLAYDLVYDKQDYAAAITLLRSLGRDDHPDVANLIGFSSRKLGRTEDAKVWYEKALASDPKHTRTWQYYGMWHLERGDRAKAAQHLARIEAICGTGCDDYTSLKLALNGEGLIY